MLSLFTGCARTGWKVERISESSRAVLQEKIVETLARGGGIKQQNMSCEEEREHWVTVRAVWDWP
jgi:hypothetical protein